MYEGIKQLADEAIVLQNKLQMEAALRNISEICTQAMDSDALKSAPTGFRAMTAEQFEADALATHRAARANPAVMESAAKLKEVVAPVAKKAKVAK